MKHRLVAVLLSALCLLVSAGATLAQKRVALVIGNSSYTAVAPLANPKNDATAIADMLQRIGFDSVELALDLSGEAMRGQLSSFSQKSLGADLALVYYAGHGIEVGGVNYLMPVDAKNLTTTTIGLQAIALESVMNSIADARQLKLVILDACRDNPFAAILRQTGGTRSIGHGLARLEPSSPETLVAYAAREGTVAHDGDGTNSPYTQALLRHLGEPDLDIRLAFGRVRDEVMQKTNKRQEPFVYGSLGGNVTALVSTQSGAVAAASPRPQEAPPVQIAAVPPPAAAATATRAIPDTDKRRIREFADKHKIPLPEMELDNTPASRSSAGSSWIGVWGADAPWGGAGRMFMVALTGIASDGSVTGAYSYGPPGAGSHVWQNAPPPAGQFMLSGKPTGNRVTFTRNDVYTFELRPDGTMTGMIDQKSTGKQVRTTLKPLWRPAK